MKLFLTITAAIVAAVIILATFNESAKEQQVTQMCENIMSIGNPICVDRLQKKMMRCYATEDAKTCEKMGEDLAMKMWGRDPEKYRRDEAAKAEQEAAAKAQAQAPAKTRDQLRLEAEDAERQTPAHLQFLEEHRRAKRAAR